MKKERKDSHTIALRGMDGVVELVQADEIRVCVPTKDCVQFWVTVGTCIVCIGIGVFFMAWQGYGSPYFVIGQALLTLALGVLIPGPNYQKILPKKVPGNQPNNLAPEREVSHATIAHNEHISVHIDPDEN